MYDKTDCRRIHETVIKDIVDIVLSVKDMDEVQYMLGKNRSFRSIAAASSNLTVVFPVVVSTSMDIQTAGMITKAVERKCVAMLQMLFSAFSISDANDAMEYISKFHTNLKIDDDISIDRFIDTVDDFAAKIDESSGIMLDREIYDAVTEDMRNLSYYLQYDSINESSVLDYKIYPGARYGSDRIVKEDSADTYNINPKGKSTVNSAPQARVMYSGNENIYQKGVQVNQMTPGTYDMTQRTIATRRDDNTARMKNKVEFYGKQILDSDIKKANELMPTLMVINFIVPDGEGGDPIKVTDAVIGVKAKMYPADSVDIINRIESKNQDNNGLNNFIRATTREISFWKDFMFAVDKAKVDAISVSKRGSSSPIWKLLERRALKSRIRRNTRTVNDATAITVLTVTQNEVEYLKKDANINLEDIRIARKLMESYNLMGICIVNETIEVAKFIWDTGDDIYENITFSSLERESSDNTYKRVVNLMTKMTR